MNQEENTDLETPMDNTSNVPASTPQEAKVSTVKVKKPRKARTTRVTKVAKPKDSYADTYAPPIETPENPKDDFLISNPAVNEDILKESSLLENISNDVDTTEGEQSDGEQTQENVPALWDELEEIKPKPAPKSEPEPEPEPELDAPLALGKTDESAKPSSIVTEKIPQKRGRKKKVLPTQEGKKTLESAESLKSVGALKINNPPNKKEEEDIEPPPQINFDPKNKPNLITDLVSTKTVKKVKESKKSKEPKESKKSKESDSSKNEKNKKEVKSKKTETKRLNPKVYPKIDPLKPTTTIPQVEIKKATPTENSPEAIPKKNAKGILSIFGAFKRKKKVASEPKKQATSETKRLSPEHVTKAKKLGITLGIVLALIVFIVLMLPKFKEVLSGILPEQEEEKTLILGDDPPVKKDETPSPDGAKLNQGGNDPLNEVAMVDLDASKEKLVVLDTSGSTSRIKILPENRGFNASISTPENNVSLGKTKLPEKENQFCVVETKIDKLMPSKINPKRRYISIIHPDDPTKRVTVETSTKALVDLLDSKIIKTGDNARITLGFLDKKMRERYKDERQTLSNRLDTKSDNFYSVEEYQILSEEKD